MKPRALVSGLVLGLTLAAAAPAQEAGVSVAAGAFLANESVYREIYGSSLPIVFELWAKAKGSFGLAAGLCLIKDNGLALAVSGGTAEYPVEFRRTTIPVVAFYQLDFKAVHVRAGAGVGVHSYEEVWTTSLLEFKGHKVSARFVLSASMRLAGRLSVVGSFVYESIQTGAGSVLSTGVDLGGFQFLGGLSFRVF
jgi:hypothetical protein